MSEKANQFVEKVINHVTVWTLVGLFIWLFKDNFIISESYDIIGIRDIDESIFHMNLELMRDHARQGKWALFFSNTGYGYGNIFWTLILLFLQPFYLFGNDQITIVMAREFSLLSLFMSYIAFCGIGRQRNYKAWQISLGILLLSTCGLVFFATQRFHNHSFITALVLGSIYFLLRTPTHRVPLIATLLMGTAVAVKLTAIYTLPVFFLVLNRDFSWSRFTEDTKMIKTNLYTSILLCSFAVFLFCPAILALIVGNKAFFTSVDSVSYILTATRNEAFNINFSTILSENLFKSYYHFGAFSFGAMVALILIVKNRRRSLNEQLIPWVSFLSCSLILIFAVTTVRDPYFLRFYIMPLIFTFSLIFLEYAQRFKRHVSILFFIFYSQWFFNELVFKPFFFNRESRIQERAVQQQLHRFNYFKKNIKLKPDERIVMDHRLIFPVGLLANYKNLTYFYDEMHLPQELVDILIFRTDSKGISEEARLGRPPYEQLYGDREMTIVRLRHGAGD